MSIEHASEVYQRGERLYPPHTLPDELHCPTCSEEEAQHWLESLGVPRLATVGIAWSPKLGLTLPWIFFVQFWEDFCYPGSDNAFVVLPNGLGTIAYEHYEMFRYAPRAI